jgi:hypothetical protein
MKTEDFDTSGILPGDDDLDDAANQDDYPETDDQEDVGGPDDDDDLTDTEDINENEDGNRNDRSANDADGNGGYPDDKGIINPGII